MSTRPRLARRTQLSLVAGIAASITLAITRLHSRRHTGTSTRSEYTRCHLVQSQHRLTARALPQLSRCPAQTPLMLAWVARAQACPHPCHTLVLSHRLHQHQACLIVNLRLLVPSRALNCPAMKVPTGPATGPYIAQLLRRFPSSLHPHKWTAARQLRVHRPVRV